MSCAFVIFFHFAFCRRDLSSYAFASITTDGIIAFHDPSDGDRLKELVTKAARKVKILVAVGTTSENSTHDRFSVMIESLDNRAKFISSVKMFIISYDLDGIDINFGASSHLRMLYILLKFTVRGSRCHDSPGST